MDNQVKELFETTTLTYAEMAETLGITPKMVQTRVTRMFTREQRKARKIPNYARSKTGALNPCYGQTRELATNYIGGEVGDGKGYIQVLKPVWYTGRVGCRYVFKHSLAMCEMLGLTEMPSGCIVHHIDGNRLNNDLSNLALMTSGAHTRLHQRERATTRHNAVASLSDAKRGGDIVTIE